MLSLSLLRTDPDRVRSDLRRRRSEIDLDTLLALDDRHRRQLNEVETLRAERNLAGRNLDPQVARSEAHRSAMRELGDRIKALESDLETLAVDLTSRLEELPNLLDPLVPDGADERDNMVLRTEGEPLDAGFPLRPHWEIGESLGILDFERGVKISGSRFYVLSGAGARLQRSLIQWMLDTHVDHHGCREVYPPFIVREQSLQAAGQLPKFRDNLYHDAEDDVWLVPTAEVPVTNLYRDEILAADQLPLRYAAYTPCFRREKMSAGRDVRGMKRGHQFDKVELYTFCRPETSAAEHRLILERAERIVRDLGLHYRVVELCSGDVGFAMQRTWDIEVWAPGCQEWLEVSSISNAGDFQARRAGIRFRNPETGRTDHPHTLNGSALALPRVMIAILEQYQQPDGSVVIPGPLRRAMGADSIASL